MFTNLFSFYRSREWETFRVNLRLKRMNENGEIICAKCGKPIVHAYDCIAHHKTTLTEANVNDYEISLNEDNVDLLHHRCHNEIHERFGTYTRHIYIVVGSPCSGKSSYVAANAGKHDLIVDVDELYKAMSINPLHDKSNRLTGNVLQVRDLLLDMIKTRNGKWISAWIITSKCRPAELERMSNNFGAEIIHIDTDKEECLLRAQDRGKKEYVEYIEEYFRDYEIYKDLLENIFPKTGPA